MTAKWLANQPAAQTGITFGAALAITISYSRSHSILLAVIHGVMGWFYVVYAALTQHRF